MKMKSFTTTSNLKTLFYIQKVGLALSILVMRAGSGGGLLKRLFGRDRKVFGTQVTSPQRSSRVSRLQCPVMFASGVCIHMILSAEPPFNDTVSKRLRSIVNNEAPSLTDKVPQVPESVAQVVDACLQKDPALRPANAKELRRMVKAASGNNIPALAKEVHESPPVPSAPVKKG